MMGRHSMGVRAEKSWMLVLGNGEKGRRCMSVRAKKTWMLVLGNDVLYGCEGEKVMEPCAWER